jgi:hypothetical protein
VKTTSVWPYYAAEAAGQEFRLSLRSVAKNLRGDYDVCIVGDIPDWYQGPQIRLPRISVTQYIAVIGKDFRPRWHYLIDQAWKYAAAAQCESISEAFIVFYDETFILEPVTLEYFLTPRYRGLIPKRPYSGNSYWQAMMRTRRRLQERKLPLWDFDSHHPFPVRKHDLPAYYAEFNPLTDPGSFPNQYLNWQGIAARIHCDFDYVNQRRCESGTDIFPEAAIVNYATVTSEIELRLLEKFPEPSPWEKP